MKTLERIKTEEARIEALVELGCSSDLTRGYAEGILYALRWVQREEK